MPIISGGASGTGGIVQASRVLLTTGDITSSSASFTDLTGVTTTITTGAHRCMIGFTCVAQHSVSGTGISFDVAIDGTRQGGTAGLSTITVPGTSFNVNPSFTYLTAVLSGGSHTFKIQWNPAAATGKVFASATAPAHFWVAETTLTV